MLVLRALAGRHLVARRLPLRALDLVRRYAWLSWMLLALIFLQRVAVCSVDEDVEGQEQFDDVLEFCR